MNIAQIEQNLHKVMKSFDKKTFIYDLLLAYGLPKASITRLRKGNLNLSRAEGEISWKKKLWFKEEYKEDLHITVSESTKSIKHNERFVIVTNYKILLAIDTKTEDKLDIELKELPKHYDFFLPWAGMEKAQHADENPADVKAAEKMAKLFDDIKKDNPDDSPEFIHGLNVFLSRLLFCFFAEDTEIFKDNQFTNAINAHTQADGSDLDTYLDKLFLVLDTAKNKRKGLPSYLDDFPYVNGGLFETKLKAPVFTRRSRQSIIDSGGLDWSAINPDIFGSMIQAVITPKHRGGLGMHYTSVPNIMKVIEPLFLNDLYRAFDEAQSNPKKLTALLHRMSKLKIFDPACGSGNFLIIAYKELRKLEIKIIQHLQVLKQAASGFEIASEQLTSIPKSQRKLAASFQVELFSRIQLTQFYGIELDDFAHEIAQLSLWLAEHQMNVEFRKEFGQTNPTLPLKEAGKIVLGNACRIDWEEVCPKAKDDEIYILGNPPYLGARMQDTSQKFDMKLVFKGNTIYKDSDYIACWFMKGSEFVSGYRSAFAFVSTNSVSQGEQVAYYWPIIFEMGLEISFAYRPFKWGNSAKGNAGVTCVIIGIRNVSSGERFIFTENHKEAARNITPYLSNGNVVFVKKRSERLSLSFPKMSNGSMARDGGYLILSDAEKTEMVNRFPEITQIIRPLFGSMEFIQGKKRWCLWIDDQKLEFARSIDEVQQRIERVKEFRLNSKAKTTNGYATIPHKFAQRCFKESNPIIVPRISSERRIYIPIGYLNQGSVVTDSANVIYDSEPFLFGILTSLFHNIWIKAVGGRLETRLRYSTEICYNTFPFPKISDQRKQELTQAAFRILEERERHPEKTLAQLYDPDKMPEGLREAHRANDQVVEKCYRARPFESDEERLEYLFKLYEKMIEEEKNRSSLFEAKKKTRKKSKKKKNA